MANCNESFKIFNSEIRLTNERRVILKEKRNDLRDRVDSGYLIVKASERYNHDIQFQSQGSFVMDTIINPEEKDCEYDIDDGLYFIGGLSREDRPTPATFHKWVIESIQQGKSTNEYEDMVDKYTCVRVKYKGQNGDFNYHVDIPIYYADNINNPELAHIKDGWIFSNPTAFIIWFEKLTQSGFKEEFILERKLYRNEYQNWFNDVRKKDHQLRKIVRYLKSWGAFVDGEMPPGIIMTILAGYNYSPNERDDISLRDTLENILSYLQSNGCKCPRPTSPEGEDLFTSYSYEQKKLFINNLKDFLESAKLAILTLDTKTACLLWKNHLGNRFPANQDDALKEKRLNELKSAILSGNAFTQNDGSISINEIGVKNKKHTNFGG